ncbi:MAG: DNA internalization-related competence protein ComEC/Rec2 [Lachnospiraceae bacterium]|nr:DNA internalization-related competence protein ComEC/Rec2 [Lachnospiraceae bacterium]
MRKMKAIKIKRPLCFFSLIFFFIVFLFTTVFDPEENIKRFASYVGEGSVISLRGRLEKKENKNGSSLLYLNDVEVWKKEDKSDMRSCKGLIVYLSKPVYDLVKELPPLGSQIRVKGKYSTYKKAENKGNFDAFKYYGLRGIYGRVTNGRIEALSGEYSFFKDRLFIIKEDTKKIYESYLKEDEAGTLTALILGDKTDLDSVIKESYQNASISHILSLSGLHIATLGLFLLKLLRRSGMNILPASLISSLIMCSYFVMTGMSVSTTRALIMFLMGLIATIAGRSYDLISAAAFSAIIILITEPGYLYDSGFLLSFLAVLGINYVNPIITLLFKEFLKKSSFYLKEGFFWDIFKKLIASLGFSLSIQISTLPITLHSFSQISFLGVFVNLLVIPLMSILLGAGIALSITGRLFQNIILTTGLCRLLAFFIHTILDIYGKLAELSTNIPLNIFVAGMPLKLQCIIYFLLLIIVYILLSGLKDMGERRRKRTARASLFILVFSFFILSLRFESDVELHVLSVGQGDCSLIIGKKTPVILVDGGSTDIKKVGKYRIEPSLKAYGISKIDMVFISHLDSDHVNGIIEILENEFSVIQIDKLILSKSVPLMEHNENYEKLIRACKKKNTRILLMDKGESIEYPKNSIYRGVRIVCLAPDVTKGQEWKRRDINDNSLVIKYSFGNAFSVLFTGDISSQVEKELSGTGRVTVLKCPHHGSKTASSMGYLQELSPIVTSISCGVDNSYGHPHKEVLERLEVLGSRVYRTDQSGEISLKLKGDELYVERCLEK